MSHPQDLRYTSRFRFKTLLLHLLFPIRIMICIVLVVISYNHWLEMANKAEDGTAGKRIAGNLVSIILFGLTIFTVNTIGWIGVMCRNWSLACAFNATSLLILMIDLYCSLFDVTFHWIALIVTILILIINIFLSFDLDAIRKQHELIRRARIEEAERRKKPMMLTQLSSTSSTQDQPQRNYTNY